MASDFKFSKLWCSDLRGTLRQHVNGELGLNRNLPHTFLNSDLD